MAFALFEECAPHNPKASGNPVLYICTVCIAHMECVFEERAACAIAEHSVCACSCICKLAYTASRAARPLAKSPDCI